MKNGYVPTIRPRKATKRMSKQMATFVKAEQTLAQPIRQEGLKALDGRAAW